MWTTDDYKVDSRSTGRFGDVKRLEALDVQDRAVLVTMRQDGLEAVDFGDALLNLGDHSRTIFPASTRRCRVRLEDWQPLRTLERDIRVLRSASHDQEQHMSSQEADYGTIQVPGVYRLQHVRRWR